VSADRRRGFARARTRALRPAYVIAASLVCLAETSSLRADAPLGRYMVSASTVLDNRTRLTWQQGVVVQAYTQPAAVSYCASLSLSGTGWRLPTVMELQSIVDDTRASPAIDPEAFPSTPSERFWTASIPGSGNAWYVSFAKGDSGGQLQTQTFRVRCVR
jgi:hypothetical protein